MLRVDWDTETTPYVDKATYITIRTGKSRAYRNVMSGLGVREPARAARIQQDMDLLLRDISRKGGEALSIPNIPEIHMVKFEPYEVAIISGVIFTSISLHGRLIGEYKMIVLMLDEVDECLTDDFKIEKYIQAALSAE
jgi:hypothetical protein